MFVRNDIIGIAAKMEIFVIPAFMLLCSACDNYLQSDDI